MMAAWVICIHRNNIIFNNAAMCLARWKHDFRELFFLCDGNMTLESYSFSASIGQSQVWSPLWVHGWHPYNICKFV
jgi:hypothetical protein